MVVISLKKMEVDYIIESILKNIEGLGLPNKKNKKKLLVPAIAHMTLTKLDGKGDLFSQKMGLKKMRALNKLLERNK